ncbi:MAG: hypothetical protein JSV21_11160, partial [Nitrospirota bacterium]
RISDRSSITGRYRQYSYDKAGNASYFGGSFRNISPSAFGYGVSAHRMAGDTTDLRYNEYRVYVTSVIRDIEATLDLIDIDYDEAINDIEHAYTALFAMDYRQAGPLKFGFDISYSKNPEFDSDMRALFRMNYRFGTGIGI